MNFKKFSASDNQWHDVPYYQHKTATDTLTLPAVIYPNASTVTVGIKGQSSQTSTPSPSSPVSVDGCGEKTANLFDQSDFTLLQVTSTAYRYGTSLGVLPQGTYTFDATKSTGAQSIYLTARLNDTYSQTTISSVPFSFTADGDSEYIIRTANNTGTTWNAEKYSNMMLNVGSTALPYEPFGYKIPILLNSQTINKYLGEVQTTRQIKKLVLDGTENWVYRSGDPANVFFMYLPTAKTGETALSTDYPYYSGTDFVDMSDKEFAIIRNNLAIRNSDYQYESQFKAYLAAQYSAGHPITVWYVLTTPTTAIINEPLMKIGNYADSLTTSIPCTAGENTLDVQTTVAPSEVAAGFSGWHPVQSVHERENGQWD